MLRQGAIAGRAWGLRSQGPPLSPWLGGALSPSLRPARAPADWGVLDPAAARKVRAWRSKGDYSSLT